MNIVNIIEKQQVVCGITDEPNSSIGANNITHSILNSASFDCKANFMENGVSHNNFKKIMLELLLH